MDRVREKQISRIFQQFGLDNSHIAFMNLRKGLPANAVLWIGPNSRPAFDRSSCASIGIHSEGESGGESAAFPPKTFRVPCALGNQRTSSGYWSIVCEHTPLDI